MKNKKLNIATGDRNADWIKLANPKATEQDRKAHEELAKKGEKQGK